MKKEIWKSVKGYEGIYEVSSKGRVRSLDRVVIDINGNKQNLKGCVRKLSLSTEGYPIVNLNRQGVKKTRTVHQLVAESFLGHTPSKYNLVVDHINGNPTDNNVSNLQLVTARANASTCYRADRNEWSSKLVGVNWNKNGQFWESRIVFDGHQYYLGSFKSERKAHSTYKKALSDINKGVFNHSDYRKPTTSNLKGVCYNGKKYVAQIDVKGSRLYIGSYSDEVGAFNAYIQAGKELDKYGVVCIERLLVRLIPFKYPIKI